MAINPWKYFYEPDPQFIEPEDIVPEGSWELSSTHYENINIANAIELCEENQKKNIECYREVWTAKNGNWQYEIAHLYNQIYYEKVTLMRLYELQHQLKLF